MKFRIALLLLCFWAFVAMSALAQEQKKVAPAPPEDPPPVLAVPQAYRYETRGRRDPFVDPIPKPSPAQAAPAEPPRPGGMKGALLADVVVASVFVSRDPAMTRVFLLVPGMRAPVLATRGDSLWDAVIKEIRSDGVIFTTISPPNKPRDPSDSHDVFRKLRSTAGDKK